MNSDADITAKVIESFDRAAYTPYSAWSQFYFNFGGSETHEGLAFCAARSEAFLVEEFTAAAIFRVMNFFGYSREEIKRELASASIRATEGPLEHCDAWRGLANTSLQGSVDMLSGFKAAYPDLQPIYVVHNLDPCPLNSFAIAENSRSYAGLYWYSTG